MLSKWFFLLLVLFLTLATVCSLKVLILFPCETRSMRNIVNPLSSGLSSRHHQVTIVGMYPGKPEERAPGVVEMPIPGAWQFYENLTDSFFNWSSQGSYEFNKNYMKYAFESMSQIFLNFSILHEWIEKESPVFDVAIVNALFSNYAIPVACHVARKCMLVSPTEIFSWLSSSMGLPYPISYVPPPGRSFVTPMGFKERTFNSLGYGLTYFAFEWYFLSRWNAQVQERFPQLKSIEKATADVSLTLVNVDPVVTVPKPGIPRIVNVGCLHCVVAKPLQGELSDFIEKSNEDGFILFSLGSVVKGSSMSQELLNVFVSTFSKLKQRVVWKFEKELENLPPNVKIVRWLPQQDILGHFKIRLFITHGGLLSMEETVFHGVPVIAFPIYAEQPGNAARMVEKGIGSLLDIHSLTEDILLETIEKMTKDESYMANAKKYSAIARDQPLQPVEQAVYWVEYVARHSDSSHLQMPGHDINLIQYFSVDILALLFAPVICFFIGLVL